MHFEAVNWLYLREADHLSGRHELRPPLQLKLRQLEAVGWAAAPVPFFEWVPLKAGSNSRLFYLQEVLHAAAASRAHLMTAEAVEVEGLRAAREKAAAEKAKAAKQAEEDEEEDEDEEMEVDAPPGAVAAEAGAAAAELASAAVETGLVQAAAAEEVAKAQ